MRGEDSLRGSSSRAMRTMSNAPLDLLTNMTQGAINKNRQRQSEALKLTSAARESPYHCQDSAAQAISRGPFDGEVSFPPMRSARRRKVRRGVCASALISRTRSGSEPISVPAAPPRTTIGVTKRRVRGGIGRRPSADDNWAVPLCDRHRCRCPPVRASGAARRGRVHRCGDHISRSRV